ncbi:MAG: hypothetical protein RMK29_04350 [Myxococcales bacterium]|nr:hypothetical protein [Myxococcota bacterium]MDW8280919.1 hypothetical protein [Myxococcales bacterium]
MLEKLSDDPLAPSAPNLLSCPNCQSPCPLGFTRQTRCVACGTLVDLSESLAAERDARREQAAIRRSTNALWQRALRIRVRWWRSPLLLVPLSFVAPFLAALVGYEFGYRDGRYGQAGLVWLLCIGAIHFATSALLESRKQEQFRGLLLAQPPKQEGGPPLCRLCGAPLSPPPGAADVSCDHCGADMILGRHGERPPPPRPDLRDAEAAFYEVYGDEVSQRASRLYPFTILVGFVVLAVLAYYAVEAPRTKLP